MPVKVLQVIDHLGLGGGQMSTKSIVENINDEQIECLVCALRPKSETVSINAKIITLNYGRYDPRTIFAVANLCKKYKGCVYNPVDFEVFDHENVSREQSRKNLGISDEDFVVGFVGRLSHVKGVDLVLKAMSLLLKKSHRYLLILAGDGPHRKSLVDFYIQLLVEQEWMKRETLPSTLGRTGSGFPRVRWIASNLKRPLSRLTN